MRTVQDVYSIINTFSPFSTQEKWDNSGLLVGTGSMPVHKIYVTLDISNETIAAAQEQGADLMVAHHPIIFSPLKQLSPDSPVWKLAAANMAAICVHTPLDRARVVSMTAYISCCKNRCSLAVQCRHPRRTAMESGSAGQTKAILTGMPRIWQKHCGVCWAVRLSAILQLTDQFGKFMLVAVRVHPCWKMLLHGAVMQ